MINEFKFNGPFLSLAANIGLFVGAVIWSFGCDIWGRRYVVSLPCANLSSQTSRWSFNLTLLIAGVFGLAAGGSQDFVTLASLIATLGVGVGGNLPVDSAVFLGAYAAVCMASSKLIDPHRSCTRDPPISSHRDVGMVVLGATRRQLGKLRFRLSPP